MDVLLLSAILVPASFALATRFAGRNSGPIAAAGALVSLGPALVVLIVAVTGQSGEVSVEWLPADGLEVGFRLDGLSALMSALVAAAGLAALFHAAGYFARDERAPRAQASLLAFIAAMQGLVLADNFITLLVFWEVVGALSARLIAYERHDPRAAPGAVRAFLTTRTADAGLYIAIAALHAGAGTVAFEAARPEGFLGAAVGLGLVVAAAGKSAQLPFQTWLSGAMAGPTPVSALLHSATMVAAGVFLLVRAGDLLAGWPLELAAWIGALTAVAAGAFALAQRDLKLILASSTTSQLGFMFLAAGVGAPAVAIFHLVCHAAGKAGAFLAAGVFQRRAGTTSLDELRGAGRDDNAAFWGFALSAASIAAVPPLAVFWSKDAILASLEDDSALLALAVIASAVTAAYLLRPVLILRRGRTSGHRTPAGRTWMLAGIGILAAGTLALGALGHLLADLLGGEVPAVGPLSAGLSLAALAAGAGVALGGRSAGPRLTELARRQLGTNRIVEALVQRPVLAVAELVARADAAIDRIVDRIGRGALGLARANDAVERRGVDSAVDGIGRGALRVARANDAVERRGVDSAVDGLARLIGRGGAELPRLQGGQLYVYLRNTVAGIFVLAGVFVIAAVTGGG